MADDKAAPPVFMDLPLEVRHCIFEYAAARDVKPKKLLRYWFEKEAVKDAIAKLAAEDPDGPAPRVCWSHHREYNEESEVDEEDEDEEDEDEEADGAEEQDSDDEENEDAEQDEDGEEDGQDEEEQDEEQEEQEAEVNEEEDEEEALDDTQVSQPAAAAPQLSAPAPAQAPVQPTPSAQPTTQIDEEQAEDEMEVDAHEGQDEEEEGEAEAQDDQADVEGEGEGDEEMADGDDDGNADAAAAPPQQPPPPVPVIHVHHKWRHIPNFMRITQCPPPVELLLTSQQLNTEAKNWFYDVAVLRIDATGSFAHTSFFEEAFKQITDAAFSPMENIRKVEVTFVWDSTWIRADTAGCVGAVFPALLGQRANFVFQILSQAPDLKEVLIHWHDSAQDDESASVMLDHLSQFHTLPATVTVKEHYIAVDAKPRKSSIAGKRRVEFQNILDMGLDRLF